LCYYYYKWISTILEPVFKYIVIVSESEKHISAEVTQTVIIQRFLLQILLLAQHVSGTNAHHQELMSIIKWLLPVVFRAVVFKLLIWCGAEGYVSGLQDAGLNQHPANRTHNPQLHTRPVT